MLKNKFNIKFYLETKMVLIALGLYLLSEILLLFCSNVEFTNVFISIGYFLAYLLMYSLLFFYFGFSTKTRRDDFLFSISFIIRLIISIYGILSNYFYYDYWGSLKSITIDIISLIGILYGFAKNKSIKVCYVFVGLLLVEGLTYVLDDANMLLTSIKYGYVCLADFVWVISDLSYLLVYIAILIFFLPSKKKYIEKEKTIEEKLKLLQDEFENNNITSEEYALRKKEYLSSL